MKTFFTSITYSVLFFGMLLPLDAFAQTYPYSELVEGTMRHGELSDYFPMRDFDNSPYRDNPNKTNIPQHYRNQGQWDTSPYLDYSYVIHTAPNEKEYLNMRLLPPLDYDEDAVDGKKYPLIVVLHGVGEAGINRSQYGGSYEADDPRYENNDHQLLFGAKEHLAARNRPSSHERHFPGFVLFPQADGGDWTRESSDKVIEIVELLIKEKKVDPLRIYIWGLSGGAVGTWATIMKRPDLFAAALPMSGVPDGILTEDFPNWPEKLAHMPIWLFQGGEDDNPSPNNATGQLNKLEVLGGTPRYTLYPKLGHGVWYDAYNEPDFFSWMLQYSELSIHAFYEKTEICSGQPLDIKLGISPGHLQYEWSVNGNPIPNSNQNNWFPTEFGEYRVRVILQGESEWTEWSDPVEVKISEPYIPEVLVSHSTTKPSLDGIATVTFTYPGEYESITWSYYKGGPYDAVKNWDNVGNERSRTFTGSTDAVWRVQVTQLNGCLSEFSDIIVVTKGAPENIITPPSDLSSTPISEKKINLFWEDNSNDERGFEIYRSMDGGANYVFVTKTEPNVTFYTDKGLEANTSYVYNMRAVNWEGSSPYTGPVIGKTLEDQEAPARPANLTAVANFDLESIALTWDPATDNIGVARYVIYEVSGSNTLDSIGNSTTTDFLVSGLTENQRYSYVVKAVDAGQNKSEPSNQASTITRPCGLMYTLYSTTDSDPWGVVANLRSDQIIATGHVNNFDIGVRTTQPQYDGTDEDSHFGFEFNGYIYIEDPGNYTFQLNSDDGSVLWIDNQEVANYDGLHGPGGFGSGWWQEKYLAVGRHPIKLKYFEKGGGNVLELRYKKSGGNWLSISDNVLCNGDEVNLIAAPSDLLATVGNAPNVVNPILLTWTDNSGNDEYGFEIFRSTSGEEESFELIHTATANAISFDDDDIEASTTYYYKVRAIGSEGQSAYTPVVSATTDNDVAPPSAPTDLTALKSNDHSALLSWTAATDNIKVVGYKVYEVKENNELVLLGQSDEEGDLMDNEDLSSFTTTSSDEAAASSEMVLLSSEAVQPTVYFTLEGLSAGTNYNIVVTAIDGTGLESEASSPAGFATSGEAVLPIELISFSGKAKSNAVQLDWQTASETDNDYFTIERADNGTDFTEIAKIEGAGTSNSERTYSFIDRNPEIGSLYYRLKQTDFNGDFEYSNIISVQFPSVTGSSAGSHSHLVLYPNPTTSENINLKLEGINTGGDAYIKIVDMLGKMHLAYHIDAKALTNGAKILAKKKLIPGIYIVIIEQSNKLIKQKLIINE